MTGDVATDSGLRVDAITVRFGGRLAVNTVSLQAPVARLTGLIGPNGAGKTTTFNVCSGLQRPTSGRVLIGGHDVTKESAASRARRGLGRTFQRMELFTSLTVSENVDLGRELALAGGAPWRHLAASRTDRRIIRRATRDALSACGIEHLADRRAADLSTGQGRLVELARVVAGGFQVLLLDEPSSGLDAKETEAFGALVRSLVDERGVGILCVEHDMALVSTVCDYLYVLDFGQMIYQGATREVINSDIVRAAYLGSHEVETVLA